MKDLEKSLLTVISEQEANIEQIEELEEVIAPACGCGCASGGLC